MEKKIGSYRPPRASEPSSKRDVIQQSIDASHVGFQDIPGENSQDPRIPTDTWMAVATDFDSAVTTLSTSEPMGCTELGNGKKLARFHHLLMGKNGEKRKRMQKIEVAFHQSRSTHDPRVASNLWDARFWASPTMQTTSSRLAENKQD